MKFFFSICLLFICLLTRAQGLTNEERAALHRALDNAEQPVTKAFDNRSFTVRSSVSDETGSYTFYKTVSKYLVHITGRTVIAEWTETLGEISKDAKLVYRYSVEFSIDNVTAIAPYTTTFKPPIGTSSDYRKIANVVLQTGDSEKVEIWETSWTEKNGEKMNRTSTTTKSRFATLPYAVLDFSCSSCTQHSLTEVPREAFKGLAKYYKSE